METILILQILGNLDHTTMRFKRGSKVEVMIKEEVMTSWRCAEIISGNGHTYNLRYDCYLGTTSEAAVERVSRKFIRPCPPPVEGAQSWLAGDIVEVFDNNSWKTAAVSKVVYGEEYYVVRLLGATQEFRVHKLSIRVRMSWQYDKWVVIGKGSGSCGDAEFCKLSTSKRVISNTNMHGGEDYLAPVQNNCGLQESHMVSSWTRKRASPYCSSIVNAYNGDVTKIRSTNEGSMRRRLVTKVDAVTYPRENLGEEYMHTSFSNRSNGYYELKGRKLNIGCSPARSSELSDSDSDECSVGSCSGISRSPNIFSRRFLAFRCRDPDTLCSDAESCNCSGQEEGENCSDFPRDEELTDSIHRLELHAYQCTVGALYASGPLTWDKEALLTNLRITLHISNDEHLMELKNLISAGVGILS
ncbi:hypothetical protein LguiA_033211 [Lonicera macranthoides]